MESENISLIIIRFMSLSCLVCIDLRHMGGDSSSCWYLREIRLDPYRVKVVSNPTWCVRNSSAVTLCSE